MVKHEKGTGLRWIILILIILPIVLYFLKANVFTIAAVVIIAIVMLLAFHKRFYLLRTKHEIGANAVISLFVTLAGTYIGFSLALRQEADRDAVAQQQEIKKENDRAISVLKAIKEEISNVRKGLDQYIMTTSYAIQVLGSLKNENDSAYGLSKSTESVIDLANLLINNIKQDFVISKTHPDLIPDFLNLHDNCIKGYKRMNTAKTFREFRMQMALWDASARALEENINFQIGLLEGKRNESEVREFIITTRLKYKVLMKGVVADFPDLADDLEINIITNNARPPF